MLVLGTVSGGVATTLGATGPDAAGDRSPASEEVRQDQTIENTSVTFENQTSNGTVVTVSQVNLTEGGFVVVHDESLLEGSVLGSVRGVSEYLEPGTYEEVRVTLDDPINDSQRLLALAYQDTNDNETFDFVESQGADDSAYTVDNQVVADDATVTVEEAEETTTTAEEAEETTTTEEPVETTTEEEVEETTTTAEEVEETTTTTEEIEETTTEEEAEETTTETTTEEAEASLTFENQTSNGTVVTISQATLPEGGFVVIHDTSLLDGSVVESVRGVSEYLEPGTHEEIRVTLDEPITESQPLLALAYQDTNDNETFDFVETQGQADAPYTVDEQVVADDAAVTVEEVEETTTTEEPVETTTEEVETTTEETETTTEETETTTEETETTTTEEIEETTTEEPVETTTEAPPETETTTEEIETTTTETETTTEATETTTEVVEEPVAEQTFKFRIDNLQIQEFSLVVGDATDVDRTVVVEDVSVSDRTVRVDLTKILSGAAPAEAVGEAANDSGQIAASDVQDVRFVFRNVTVQNVEFVVTAPEDVEFDLPDEMMPETTTVTETPTETTTEEEPTETTTTEEEPPTETTTTAEEPPTETTTTAEEEPTETTTEEATPTETPTETTEKETPTETTTTEEEPTETTTEEPAADEPSLRVPALDAPGTIVLDEGTLVVNAQVSNPSDQVVTDVVELRIDGTLVEQRRVKVDPGESVQIQYTVSKADLDLEPGQTFLDVLTTDFGKSVEVTVRDGPPEDDENDSSN
ncbi:DUF7282 domain-containing protein [Halorussus salinus]|uniref:DUF7282 domain-containing protein n=1 Tax=Halorussus salinus TaxID=1364935 RepID=UPI00138EE278|nr:hypothetical protein [Halorussus salinus]